MGGVRARGALLGSGNSCYTTPPPPPSPRNAGGQGEPGGDKVSRDGELRCLPRFGNHVVRGHSSQCPPAGLNNGCYRNPEADRLMVEARRELPALPSFKSGGALVDVADRDALYRAMEER